MSQVWRWCPATSFDRVGESRDQVCLAFARQPPEKGGAESVRVPRDSVVADRLRSADSSAIEKHHGAGCIADEVFIRPAVVTRTGGRQDLHLRDPNGVPGLATVAKRRSIFGMSGSQAELMP